MSCAVIRSRSGALDASLYDIANTQLPPDLLSRNPSAFESEARIAGYDEECANAGKGSRHVLDYAVREIFLVRSGLRLSKGSTASEGLSASERGVDDFVAKPFIAAGVTGTSRR